MSRTRRILSGAGYSLAGLLALYRWETTHAPMFVVIAIFSSIVGIALGISVLLETK